LRAENSRRRARTWKGTEEESDRRSVIASLHEVRSWRGRRVGMRLKMGLTALRRAGRGINVLQQTSLSSQELSHRGNEQSGSAFRSWLQSGIRPQDRDDFVRRRQGMK
jgi:hypothetical protein